MYPNPESCFLVRLIKILRLLALACCSPKTQREIWKMVEGKGAYAA